MLVLTTMFINVSNNLPKTSYVFEVLVHTYMDSLRSDGLFPRYLDQFNKQTFSRNDDDREINHHGRPVEVGEQDSRRGSSAVKVL